MSNHLPKLSYDKSIAVLPFVNMSSNEENEYFSDGMTEEIINALVKLKELKVTSRTSSFYFKNKNTPISQIGQALNVSTILEGSIRFSGNKLRITAQLIDVADDFHFWSETFNRSMNDIFALQDEISMLIADKLREHLGHFEIGKVLLEFSIDKEVKLSNESQFASTASGVFGARQTNVENSSVGGRIYLNGVKIQTEFITKPISGILDSTLINEIEPTLKEFSKTIGKALQDYEESYLNKAEKKKTDNNNVYLFISGKSPKLNMHNAVIYN